MVLSKIARTISVVSYQQSNKYVGKERVNLVMIRTVLPVHGQQSKKGLPNALPKTLLGLAYNTSKSISVPSVTAFVRPSVQHYLHFTHDGVFAHRVHSTSMLIRTLLV